MNDAMLSRQQGLWQHKSLGKVALSYIETVYCVYKKAALSRSRNCVLLRLTLRSTLLNCSIVAKRINPEASAR